MKEEQGKGGRKGGREEGRERDSKSKMQIQKKNHSKY